MLRDLPLRDESGSIRVVIETPRGSEVKLKYDAAIESFVWSRGLSLGVEYPYDFGFLPQTLADDGEALDAMIFHEMTTYPGVVVPCRAVGALRVEQQRGDGPVKRNDRIIVVPENAHRRATLTDIAQVPERLRDELVEFFRASLVLTGKNVEFRGWANAAETVGIIAAAAARFEAG